MATSSISGHSRPAAFVVRRVSSKGNTSPMHPVKVPPRRCEQMQMTKQETEVFFAACEAPFQAEVNIFEHLPEVAQWFKK